MMYKWLPKDSEPNLPPACHTNLGVGAMVFNKKNQLLAISEKHYEYPHWKLPGGYVEQGMPLLVVITYFCLYFKNQEKKTIVFLLFLLSLPLDLKIYCIFFYYR